ncbi:hypothetical protein GCM10027299_39950 [Larkinella ripae]
MDPFRKRKKKHTVSHTVPSHRERIRVVINVILCLIGLVFGYFYLVNGLILGWLFLAAFTFFLFVQFAKPTDYDI